MDSEQLQRALAEERHRREEAEKNLAEAQKITDKVSFLDYIQSCHQYLHGPVSVQPDKTLNTTGRLLVPKDRYRPDWLAPWHDFPTLTQSVLGVAHSHFHPLITQQGQERVAPLLLFSPSVVTQYLSSLFCTKPLASEMDVRYYEHTAVEVHVAAIINELARIPEARTDLNLADGVVFQNEPKSVGATPQSPTSRTGSTNEESDFEEEKDRTRADQFCVRKQGGNGQLMHIAEYKPPHKLTLDTINAGFRPMDVNKVLQRPDVPPLVSSDSKNSGKKRKRVVWKTEAERSQAKMERFQYDADCLVSAVAIQTFHYMIASGLSYSYIATGVAFIFLHIDYKDPSRLYYHVSAPDQQDNALPYFSTAVGQVLALSLLAARTDQKSQRVRQEARLKLSITPCFSFYAVLSGSLPSTVKTDSTHSDYMDTSRHKKKKCDDEDSDGGQSPPPRTTRASSRNQQAGGSTKQSDSKNNLSNSNASQGRYLDVQHRYCTQKCLLGLMQGSRLDFDCPNVLAHNGNGSNHLVSATEFPELLRNQLAEDLDHYCEPLWVSGARGYLFRVTLACHGYVFVAKGTTRGLISHLRHEGNIYEHLKSLQGTAIPVHLGNINLVHRYFLDWIPIKHFLLLSWGGDNAGYNERMMTQADPRIELEVRRTWREVWNANVGQGDYRGPNFLWNAEANRVMLIDFERARFRKAKKLCAAEEPKPTPIIEHSRPSTLKRKADVVAMIDSKHTKTGDSPLSKNRRQNVDGLVN